MPMSHDEAKDAFRKAVELRPGEWRGHYALGRYVLMRLGDFDAAEQHMETAEELNPTDVQPKLALGWIQLNRGRLDEAELWFRQALDISSHQEAHSQLGYIYYHQGRFDQALTRFQRAGELEPGRPRFRLWEGHTYRQWWRRGAE